jgi:hypothetical protein
MLWSAEGSAAIDIAPMKPQITLPNSRTQAEHGKLYAELRTKQCEPK